MFLNLHPQERMDTNKENALALIKTVHEFRSFFIR